MTLFAAGSQNRCASDIYSNLRPACKAVTLLIFFPSKYRAVPKSHVSQEISGLAHSHCEIMPRDPIMLFGYRHYLFPRCFIHPLQACNADIPHLH
jgi:hypothetical protein